MRTVILLIFFAVTGFAQQQLTAADVFRAIGFLEGNWRVFVNARLSAQGPWETSEAKSVIIKTVGSTVLQEDLTGQRQGKPFFTKTLLAVNNLTLQYQRVSVDSEHGALIDYEGHRQGDSLFFDRTWVYPSGGTVKLRALYRIISSDEFIVETMRMPEKTTSWDVTGRMLYKRMSEKINEKEFKQ